MATSRKPSHLFRAFTGAPFLWRAVDFLSGGERDGGRATRGGRRIRDCGGGGRMSLCAHEISDRFIVRGFVLGAYDGSGG